MSGVPTGVPFAHDSEESFAALLDERGIAWEYEPHRFVTRRASDGQVEEAFVPDFYLPALGLYVECTTMRAALMGRKRRKARRAMEQYGIRVMIVVLPALEQDLHGRLGRTSALEQVNRFVKVDARGRRKQLGLPSVIAGALELLETPLTDVLVLRWG